MSDVQTRVGILPEVRGAGSAASEIARVYQALRAGSIDVKSANEELRKYSGEIYGQRRALSLLRTEWRNNNAALLEGMRTLSGVARIGRTLTSVYQTHTLMQIRLADKTRDIRDIEGELAKTQEMRRKIVQDLGAENVYALSFMDEEERLTKRLVEEKRDLSRAQQENILGYVGIGLSIVDTIPSMVSIYQHASNLRTILGDTSWKAATLETLSTAAAGAETAIAAVGTAWTVLANLLGAGLVIGGIVYAATTPEEKLEEERLKFHGTTGPGYHPDYGITWEQLESDLPPDSLLWNLYPGGEFTPGERPDFTKGDNINVNVGGGDTDIDVSVDVTVEKIPKSTSYGKFGGGGGRVRR